MSERSMILVVVILFAVVAALGVGGAVFVASTRYIAPAIIESELGVVRGQMLFLKADRDALQSMLIARAGILADETHRADAAERRLSDIRRVMLRIE